MLRSYRLLGTLITLNAASAMLPLLVLLPLLQQQSWAISLAYAASRLAFPFSLMSLLVALLIAAGRWRVAGRSARRGMVGGIAILLGTTLLSRARYAEVYFNPAGTATLSSIGSYREVLDDDFVLGVVLNGVTRAYPVRYLAYHHVLNDELNGVKLLPTF